VNALDFLKGKWLGHPLHPALVHIPLALLPSSLIFDLLSRSGMGGNSMVRTAFFAILFGIIAALAAIPTGIVDWMGIKRGKPAWKLGLYHMILNVLATIAFGISFALRCPTFRVAQNVETLPLLLSAAGTLLLLVSAYLGGRMVYAYGISVARMSKAKWRKIAEAGGANLPPEK
jgi:uncharacterized membrane protein